MRARFVAALLAALAPAGLVQCSAGQARVQPAPEPPPKVDDRASVDQLRELILRALNLSPGMRSADIGLGRGWFVSRMAQATGPGGSVYATDIDPEAIRAMQQMPRNPEGSPISARLCRDARDTALDDLPEGHLDVILMVDSLCFEQPAQRAGDVAYLRKLLRVLRPDGRLIHHMDCHCATQPDAVKRLFADAGFATGENVAVPDTLVFSTCRSEAERARSSFIGVMRKPPVAP